jgi:hypothetical protein
MGLKAQMGAYRLFLVGVLWAGTILAADPWAGTWKMRIKPNSPIASRTLTEYESGPHTIHITFEDVSKTGEKKRSVQMQICDGKEHASGTSGFVSICEITGPDTRVLTIKKDGKVVGQATHSLSRDGKVNVVGDPTSPSATVYDKQ